MTLADLEDVTCLGKKNDAKYHPIPLQVTLASRFGMLKLQLISLQNLFSKTNDLRYKSTFIDDDKSPKERKIEYEPKRELWHRKAGSK